MFAGYAAYTSSLRFFRKYGFLPAPVRSLAAWGMHALPQSFWNLFLPGNGVSTAGARIHRLASTLRQPTRETTYRNLMSYWEDPESVVPGAVEPATAFTSGELAGLSDTTEKMMMLDSLVYLPDDILVKVDRASMAVGLEARAPLLDYRLFEFAWRVPLEFKTARRQGQMDPARAAEPLRSPGTGGPAEVGFRDTGRPVAAGSSAGVGGRSSGRTPLAPAGYFESRRRAPLLERAPRRVRLERAAMAGPDARKLD